MTDDPEVPDDMETPTSSQIKAGAVGPASPVANLLQEIKEAHDAMADNVSMETDDLDEMEVEDEEAEPADDDNVIEGWVSDVSAEGDANVESDVVAPSPAAAPSQREKKKD